MTLETERLILREYTLQDFDPLFQILSDSETMKHYPHPYSAKQVRSWIDRNIQRYKELGFGMWAVILKTTGKLIGNCGLTIQPIDGELLPEIGYHIHKSHWRNGFGSEAARVVINWAFTHTEYDCLYSYMKQTNIGSHSTARSVGMKKTKDFTDSLKGDLCVYSINRCEWELFHNTANITTYPCP